MTTNPSVNHGMEKAAHESRQHQRAVRVCFGRKDVALQHAGDSVLLDLCQEEGEVVRVLVRAE